MLHVLLFHLIVIVMYRVSSPATIRLTDRHTQTLSVT